MSCHRVGRRGHVSSGSFAHGVLQEGSAKVYKSKRVMQRRLQLLLIVPHCLLCPATVLRIKTRCRSAGTSNIWPWQSPPFTEVPAIQPFVQPPVVMTGSFPASSTIEKFEQPQLFFAPPVPTQAVVEKENRPAKKRRRSTRRSSSSTRTSQLRRRSKARKSLKDKRAKKAKDQDESSEKQAKKVVRRRKEMKQNRNSPKAVEIKPPLPRMQQFSAPSSLEL